MTRSVLNIFKMTRRRWRFIRFFLKVSPGRCSPTGIGQHPNGLLFNCTDKAIRFHSGQVAHEKETNEQEKETINEIAALFIARRKGARRLAGAYEEGSEARRGNKLPHRPEAG